MRVAAAVVVDDSQREMLTQWERSRTLSARQVERARVVLLAAEGKTDLEIAASLRISNKKASRWRKRFLRVGLAGLKKDASRPGRTPLLPLPRGGMIRLGSPSMRRSTESAVAASSMILPMP